MELSQEDGTLVGLSSLGPDHYFKWPDQIVDKATGKMELAARSFDRNVLENLVVRSLAEKQGEGGYAITQAGGDRVLEILFEVTPTAEVLSDLVKSGVSIGIHWIGDRFKVIGMVGSTPHVADDFELGKAILAVRKAVGKTLSKV